MVAYNKARIRKPLLLKIVMGFSVPVAIIVALCLVLEIWGFGFEKAQCQHERGFFRKLWCGISATYEANAQYVRLLPSDEEMIAHFRRHRVDFERLVQIYRNDQSLYTPWGGLRDPPPHVKEIMERIGVYGVLSDWTIWMPPDPYSEEAQQQVKTLGLIPMIRRGYPEARKFSGVRLWYAPGHVKRLNENLSDVLKGYYYTPFVPKIENGLLNKPSGGEWIASTLNNYPSRLKSGECVYRQFEPHWFIELCQGLP
jgi:hypothetical protein